MKPYVTYEGGIWLLGVVTYANGVEVYTGDTAPTWADAMRRIPSLRTRHRQEVAAAVGLEVPC